MEEKEKDGGAGELGRGSEIWASPPSTSINSQDSKTLIKRHGRGKTDIWRIQTSRYHLCLQYLESDAGSEFLVFHLTLG